MPDINQISNSASANQLKPELSVICPFFNEAGNLKQLHKKIKQSLDQLNQSYEIIFINDGSTDDSLEKVKDLAPLTLINFRRNFGQTAALDCGFKYAQGKIILTLDSDLQNDPADFSKLIAKINQGYDVVSGWRKNRQDSFSKKFASKVAEFLRKFLINDHIHDSGCTLKAYRKECFEHIDLYGEMHRFIPAILKIQGFRITEVIVKHHPRTWGKTKYGATRALKGFLDIISVWFWKKYSSRPLHLFGGIGLASFLAGAGLLLTLLILRMFWGVPLSDKIWPLLSLLLILAGIQLLISGLLADIAIKGYYNSKRLYYSIKNIKISKSK
ncbi:MAG: glycosyltransferase [Candidatus Moranbacteria bacterium]|nr:glycosyltransferase [Candidatus Moranbacteria bacterium]